MFIFNQISDNVVAVSTQPVFKHARKLNDDVLYIITKLALAQCELVFPYVPSIIQALEGVAHEEIYKKAIRLYLEIVKTADIDNYSVHKFPSPGEFFGVSTANMSLRDLSISFRGINEHSLSANLRDYMTRDDQDLMPRLTEDFATLLAPLETLTITRERCNKESKMLEFSCLINILTTCTKLRELIIVYEWSIDVNGVPFKDSRDMDMSQSRFRDKMNTISGVPVIGTWAYKERIGEKGYLMQQIHTWVARTGSVLLTIDVTEEQKYGWLEEFMKERKDERRTLL
ncbi:hypothetical protein NHQ30_007721 [Ciborinia camelliae]|nr:hypothetical protein NHQ30_007721 [Ciborinia camelliae]